jgi:predicted CopG family antitoxin
MSTTIQVQDDVYKMLNILKKELNVESYNDVVRHFLRKASRAAYHCNHTSATRGRLEVESRVARFWKESPPWEDLGRQVPLGRRSQ